jgi:hypothetical protein
MMAMPSEGASMLKNIVFVAGLMLAFQPEVAPGDVCYNAKNKCNVSNYTGQVGWFCDATSSSSVDGKISKTGKYKAGAGCGNVTNADNETNGEKCGEPVAVSANCKEE